MASAAPVYPWQEMEDGIFMYYDDFYMEIYLKEPTPLFPKRFGWVLLLVGWGPVATGEGSSLHICRDRVLTTYRNARVFLGVAFSFWRVGYNALYHTKRDRDVLPSRSHDAYDIVPGWRHNYCMPYKRTPQKNEKVEELSGGRDPSAV